MNTIGIIYLQSECIGFNGCFTVALYIYGTPRVTALHVSKRISQGIDSGFVAYQSKKIGEGNVYKSKVTSTGRTVKMLM